MSFELTQQVIRFQYDLKPLEKLVLATLADKIDDTGWCYPSIRGLAHITGMSKNGVQQHINRLLDMGILEKKKKKGKNNKYAIDIVSLAAFKTNVSVSTYGTHASNEKGQVHYGEGHDQTTGGDKVTTPVNKPVTNLSKTKYKNFVEAGMDALVESGEAEKIIKEVIGKTKFAPQAALDEFNAKAKVFDPEVAADGMNQVIITQPTMIEGVQLLPGDKVNLKIEATDPLKMENGVNDIDPLTGKMHVLAKPGHMLTDEQTQENMKKWNDHLHIGQSLAKTIKDKYHPVAQATTDQKNWYEKCQIDMLNLPPDHGIELTYEKMGKDLANYLMEEAKALGLHCDKKIDMMTLTFYNPKPPYINVNLHKLSVPIGDISNAQQSEPVKNITLKLPTKPNKFDQAITTDGKLIYNFDGDYWVNQDDGSLLDINGQPVAHEKKYLGKDMTGEFHEGMPIPDSQDDYNFWETAVQIAMSLKVGEEYVLPCAGIMGVMKVAVEKKWLSMNMEFEYDLKTLKYKVWHKGTAMPKPPLHTFANSPDPDEFPPNPTAGDIHTATYHGGDQMWVYTEHSGWLQANKTNTLTDPPLGFSLQTEIPEQFPKNPKPGDVYTECGPYDYNGVEFFWTGSAWVAQSKTYEDGSMTTVADVIEGSKTNNLGLKKGKLTAIEMWKDHLYKWKEANDEQHKVVLFTNKQVGMLNTAQKKCAELEFFVAMRDCIKDWKKFVNYANLEAGTDAKPKTPNIDYFVKHLGHAIDYSSKSDTKVKPIKKLRVTKKSLKKSKTAKLLEAAKKQK